MQAAPSLGSWADFVQDPAWIPHFYDPRRDTLTFARVPREKQRTITFLDPRFVSRDAETSPAPISELPLDLIQDARGPLHFVFHTGFCCSTLLARALDIPGVAMGLKEPAVLASFAEYWSSSRRTAGALEALTVTLDLLSRPLSPGEAQVVKPSTVANHIIPQLLHARPDAKAIVLFSGLDTFLRAIARRGFEGRIFARELFFQFAPVIPLDAGAKADQVVLHADLQIAAQAWLMQAAFMDSIAKRFGRRVRVLNSETFLADPATTLSRVGDFFGLAIPPKLASEIANSAVFHEHAKELGRPFDAESRRAQYEEAGVEHRLEIAMARDWARNLALRCSAPLTLEETLGA
ncbi:MAG: hypothetical protein R3C30_10450 [Hyphomonadaceae bacterium]